MSDWIPTLIVAVIFAVGMAQLWSHLWRDDDR